MGAELYENRKSDQPGSDTFIAIGQNTVFQMACVLLPPNILILLLSYTQLQVNSWPLWAD